LTTKVQGLKQKNWAPRLTTELLLRSPKTKDCALTKRIRKVRERTAALAARFGRRPNARLSQIRETLETLRSLGKL
jgi:hypothetical protein